MTLSDWASIGSLVSGIAVPISLVYLSLQVRQAERIQRSSIRDSRATRIVDIFMGATEALLADAISKCNRGDADVSETQIRQFLAYSTARLIHAEEAFNQHKEGPLSKSAFEQLGRALRIQFSFPGSRAIYFRVRASFANEFVVYADNLAASTPIGFAGDIPSSFKSDVAAEIAKVRN